jgi:hypothetical protein
LQAGGPLPAGELEGIQDKHIIAGAVKKVLQEHEPLLTYGLYDRFMAVQVRRRHDDDDDDDDWTS